MNNSVMEKLIAEAAASKQSTRDNIKNLSIEDLVEAWELANEQFEIEIDNAENAKEADRINRFHAPILAAFEDEFEAREISDKIR